MSSERENKLDVLGSPTYLSSESVFEKVKDAIVDVEGISVLQPGQINFETGEIEAGPGDQFIYRVAGSGFFTDCRYIITTASLVIVPRFVQNDPADPTSVLIRNPLSQNEVVRANRIFVRLYNVNGCGCSYLYEAVLVGIDPAANVAILRIDQKLPFNKKVPEPKIATFIKWGKSCKYPIGSHVYNVANSEQSVRQFNGGYVRNNHNPDVRFKYYSSVDTSIAFFQGMIGSPLLDANGNAIAMVTGQSKDINNDQITERFAGDSPSKAIINTESAGFEFDEAGGNDYQLPFPNFGFFGDLRRVKGSQQTIRGVAFGVPEELAKRIARRFIKSDQGKCNKKVILVSDPVGSFFLNRKGWLNFHAELATTNTWLNHNLSVNEPEGKEPVFAVRVPFCAELTGYFVRCINEDSTLNTPGGPGVGDIITSIACQKLGECGISLYEAFWKLAPGDTVTITFYSVLDGYAIPKCIMVKLEDIALDFPLEAISILNRFNQQLTFGADPIPLCDPFGLESFRRYISGGLGAPGDVNTPEGPPITDTI